MSPHDFRRYAEYRASEYEWLGEIPAHWRLKPVKHLCAFAGGSTPAKENRRYWDGGTVPWVSPKDMKVFWLSGTQDQITEAAVEESSVTRVAPGALLMVVRSGILQRTIPVAINSVGVTLNQDMKALTFSDPQGAEYFAYLVQGHVPALLQRWTKEGATVESVEHEFLANDSIPDIPADERRAIVAFLDYETAKIDALIEKQRNLIALLGEKRQAVISHAVTKGLDPDAPMRDSGVEWLGEVPAHWKLRRLSHESDFQSGKAHEPFVDDDGAFICVNSRFVSTQGLKRKFCTRNLAPTQVNDVLMVMSDLPNGRALARAFFVSDKSPYAVNQRVCIVRARRANPKYLYYLLDRNQHFLRQDDGANQTHLSNATFMKCPILVPPLAEQAAIAEHLNQIAKSMDELGEGAEAFVSLLLERRSVLISAAVTGKIDVRGWKAPQSEAAVEVA